MAIAEFDPLDLFDEHGAPLPLEEVPEHARKAIAGLEVAQRFIGEGEDKVPVTVRKYRFESRLKALETLAKHLQLLVARWR
jgi:phage terminase small subunit